MDVSIVIFEYVSIILITNIQNAQNVFLIFISWDVSTNITLKSQSPGFEPRTPLLEADVWWTVTARIL